MSFEAINWVRKAHHIKAPARVVLYVLADHAKPHRERGTGDAHVSWPSIETIAKESGLGTATVERALKKAKKEGWIRIHSRRVTTANGACNLYEVPINVMETESDEVPIRESEVPITQSEVSIRESEVPIRVMDKPKEPKRNRKKPLGFEKNGGTGAISLSELHQWIDKQKLPISWTDPAKVLAKEFIAEMKEADWRIHGQPVQSAHNVFLGRLEKKDMWKRKRLLDPK